MIARAPLNLTELLNGPSGSLDLWGRMQMLGVGEYVPIDDTRNSSRLYLFIEQARLGVQVKIFDYNYYTELSLGGESYWDPLRDSKRELNDSALLYLSMDRTVVKH